MSDEHPPAGTPAPSGPSKEMWGAISAIAVALIGAIVTLAVHFAPSHAEAPAPVAATVAADPKPPNASIDALAGHWTGTALTPGAPGFAVDVVLARGCTPGARCGTISVSNTPCAGGLYLHDATGTDYEFDVADFVPPSDPNKCKAGGGEHLQLQPDNTLIYYTTYSTARAVLKRQ